MGTSSNHGSELVFPARYYSREDRAEHVEELCLPAAECVLHCIHVSDIGYPGRPCYQGVPGVMRYYDIWFERESRVIEECIVPLVERGRAGGMHISHIVGSYARYPQYQSVQIKPAPIPEPDWALPPHPHRERIAEEAARRNVEFMGEGFGVDLRGAEASLVAPPVTPLKQDWVVSNGNELATHMNMRGAKSIFYVGFEAGSCLLNISSAVIDMSRRGYRCFIVEEGSLGLETAETRPDERMKFAFYRVAQMGGFCYLVHAQDILDGLPALGRGEDVE
jgi:hypothetical protein